MKYSSWMHETNKQIGDIKLCDLVIPGTHDSGSYNISENSDYSSDLPNILKKNKKLLNKKFIAGWAKTQNKSIAEQLNDGIRYFDFRIDTKGRNREHYLVHSMYSVPLAEVLNDIYNYITKRENRKEIILIDIQEINRALEYNVAKQIIDTIGKEFFVSNSFSPNSTINEIISSDSNVILFMKNNIAEWSNIIWVRNRFLESPYDEDEFHSPNDSLKYIEKHISKRDPSKFFVLQGINTPDKETYILSKISPRSPEITKKLESLPKEIKNLKKEIKRYKNKISHLDWWNPADYDNYVEYSYRLSIAEGSLLIKQEEYKYLKATTAPPNLEVFARMVNRAIDWALFTKWTKKDLNIVIVDYYDNTDFIEDIVETYLTTPAYIDETFDDIHLEQDKHYDSLPGELFRSLDNWCYPREYRGAYPNFEFNRDHLSFNVFGEEIIEYKELDFHEVGLRRNMSYYDGENNKYHPEEAFRLVNRWAIKNGYKAGFPNFQARENRMGVLGLKGDLVYYEDVNYREIGLNGPANTYKKNPGEAIRMTRRWAIKRGYLTAFPNFEGQGEMMGVTFIKKRSNLPKGAFKNLDTPIGLRIAYSDIPVGGIEHYDIFIGKLFKNMNIWCGQMSNAKAAYPDFEYQNEFTSFTLFGNELVDYKNVSIREVGLRESIEQYQGGNNNWLPGEALRMVHRWAIKNGYKAGFPNFEGQGEMMGVFGLKGDLVCYENINYREIGLNGPASYYDNNPGEAIRMTRRWAIKNGYLTGFPNFEGQEEMMGVILIKK